MPPRLPLALLAVAAAGVAACGSSSPSSAAQAACSSSSLGSATSVPGAPLRTILRVPAGNRRRRAPLVVALHFASGDGREMEQATRLTPEARRSRFDVAYPTATSNGFWQPSDLPKLDATITAIEKAACIDRRRVYLLGMSNGGGMGALGACRMADKIAAVALFAPAVDFAGSCSPSRPIPVLEVHGTSDPIVPYAGGRAFIGAWARRDGCGARPVTTRVGARATRLRWRGCRGGASVQHLRLARGRHIELFPDLRAAGIDPAATAWRFLSAHPS